MLEEIMRHIHNFFPVGYECGTFEISGGKIGLPETFEGKYILIEGSLYNDGVHQVDDELTDETFKGFITTLAPPPAFLSLADEISEWQTKNGAVSPYASESFGGYTYTRATNTLGNAAGWTEAFASRLNAWRRL